MTVGGSIFLVAVGAILRYAVTDTISGVNLATIGLILMIAGIVGHGIGRALTEAAVARLHDRGAGTVLLFATDMGRPLYERLGFVIEGAATAWRGTSGAIPTGVQMRRLREDDRAAVSALDRAATGE